MVTSSQLAQHIQPETAFTVLAAAKQWIARGKDVYELEIGDSPFPTPTAARQAGIAAIEAGKTHYGPAIGLPEFREAAADFMRREYQLEVSAQHIVAGQGGKIFQQLFCEQFLDPGDEVLIFTPHFPTYVPNLQRRGAHPVFSRLELHHEFRPALDDVERFVNRPRAKAIFLNSPHNPTGGVTTADDLRQLAELVRGRNLAVFSDEPYDRMVWRGDHQTLLAHDGLLEQTVAAYTFSKSYSMSGWRLGFAVTAPAIATALGNLINTSLSCVPPFIQEAGIAALRAGDQERDACMKAFGDNVQKLAGWLNAIEGVECVPPAGTFYAFPSVLPYCRRYGITSQGLALYLLEGADEERGLACLGGECFGAAGFGFLRLSCAESLDRLEQAAQFLDTGLQREDRVRQYLDAHPEFRWTPPAEVDA